MKMAKASISAKKMKGANNVNNEERKENMAIMKISIMAA
jgi:hypothetical protein